MGPAPEQGPQHGIAPIMPWAAGVLLPTEGTTTWRWSVQQVRSTWRQPFAGVHVGVCDAAALHGWELMLETGQVRMSARDEQGRPIWGAPPPEGYPIAGNGRVVDGWTTLSGS